MESTYNRHLSLFGGAEETQPLLSKYRECMELFPNFFSSFASSIHARFAVFTGLYPVRDFNSFTLERVEVQSIFEVMHEHGYECTMFYSSFLDFTGFRGMLAGRGLSAIYDANTMPGERKSRSVAWGLREDETLNAIQDQLRKYGQNKQRFFMTYVPAAPHYPYDAVPDRFHKFKPFKVGDYTPMYLNELLYLDWVLASILDELKKHGLLEKTLVVITDDHGEMLGEKDGPIGHGWLLTPELANAPLIIMDPRMPGYRVNYRCGSQVDLLPTLLERLSIPVPCGELYQGRSMNDSKAQDNRLVYLSSYQQFGILCTNQLWMGDRDKLSSPRQNSGDNFRITNENAQTFFKDLGSSSLPSDIRQFDRFQEGLLQNYSYYRKALAGKSERGRLTVNQPSSVYSISSSRN